MAQAPDGATRGEQANDRRDLIEAHEAHEAQQKQQTKSPSSQPERRGNNGSDPPGENLTNYSAPSRATADPRSTGESDE